ncbi:Penicillin-binding protein 4* [Aquisphaera giovannonii]|uniref:Penicillin-binding protein 4 n=1 Tax=Aquisphaera giovannonii TaxID=406548 RepID=A0A5B9VVA5_9BACT|nr:serine hydrolase [Aquisphaera giovannonii]QEH32178.1 Penicillin-binding protein 4* [Aquisphaera giovannonii]
MRQELAGRSARWKSLAGFAAALLIGASAARGQNGAVGVAYPASGITIDGRLDDWPEGRQTYPIERVEAGDKRRDPKDLKASFRVAYDPGAHALFFAVVVDDDSIVLDGPGEPAWDGQDGCELFLDAAHSEGGSPFTQYARYGNQSRTVGPAEVPEARRKVAVERAGSRITYEWRIEVDPPLDPDRAIGFDVSVADKDEDGSFSWVAWGQGTQKIQGADRCGELLLARPETRFGELEGRADWEESSKLAPPSRVRVRSASSSRLWRDAPVDPYGSYRVAMLPEGAYTVRPVDTPDVRVREDATVEVRVEPGRLATAEPLRVTPIPPPGLIEARGILRGDGPVDAAAIDRFARAYLDYFKTPGISLAVIKDWKVVYRRGLGVKDAATRQPVADDTVFEAASMTKPVFADLVLRLVDRGVIELDAPLYTYLPYEDIAHDERYKQITARMVLTHRSGFPNWRTGKLEMLFAPGTRVSYSGEGFVYLGKVVEKRTGKKLEGLIQAEVLGPLGVEHASLIFNDDVARLTATGHAGASPLPKWKPTEPNTAASLHVSAGEYAKFLIGVVRGKGLAEATAREMLRPQVAVGPERPRSSWGLGISIEETPLGLSYGHGGRNTGFTSRSILYRDYGFGYVFLVNNDDAEKFDDVLGAYLITGLAGLKAPAPIAHRAVKVDPKLFDAYAGRYEVRPDEIVTVTREGDRLMAQSTHEGKVELYPESEADFFTKPTSRSSLTFVKDEKGTVTHITLHEDGHDSTARRLKGD